MRLVRPPKINLKMTVRVDCAVSAWSPPQPPTLVRKALAQLIVRAESWPLDKHLPSLVAADIRNAYWQLPPTFW